MRDFSDLTEAEVLALAISNEEEDGRIYADFAHALRADFPGTAEMFIEMATEEEEHRRQLIDTYSHKFGDHIPYIRRQDIRGNVARKPIWRVKPLGVTAVRHQAAAMERDAERFYRKAAARSTDTGIRKLLGNLAEAEAGTWPVKSSNDTCRPTSAARKIMKPVGASCFKSSSRASSD